MKSRMTIPVFAIANNPIHHGLIGRIERNHMLSRLLNIGFRHVGSWHLVDFKLGFTLHSTSSTRNALFAFVARTEILFIRKTTNSFKRRLYDYRNAKTTQYSNYAVGRLLSLHLLAGITLGIYVLPDYGVLHLGSTDVNLASVLEDSLISELKPAWNICGLKG